MWLQSNSVEAMGRRSLFWVIFWRVIGETFIAFFRRFFMMIAEWFLELERSAFYCELHSARRYQAATGLDLGLASGQPGRYSGLDAEAVEAVRRRMRGEES